MSTVKFAKSHEWARVEGDAVVVGITDYAQKQLGDIVFVDLPKAGTALVRAGQFGTVESTKAASELYAPVSGSVVEINKDLPLNPQWVNEDPMGKGWMIKIKISKVGELSDLMDETVYKDFVAKEAH